MRYIILCVIVLSMASCQDQTEIYEDFANEFSGRTYPGKVLNPVAYCGKERIKIEVLNPGDPSVTEIRIFWNFYADSISIPATSPNEIMNVILEDMPEETYSFFIRSYDNDGNVSVPVELFGTSYGDKYQDRITNRVLISSEINVSELTLEFGDADISSGAVETLVKYIDLSDNEITKTIPVSETALVISDYKSGAEYATVFMPDENCIDSFLTLWESI